MNKIEINNSDEITYLLDELNNEPDNQITISLKMDIKHNHRIRFFNKEAIQIINEDSKEIEYTIQLDPNPISDYQNWEFNGTNFFFSGNSVFIFSNISFIHEIDDWTDILTVEKKLNPINNQFVEIIESIDEELIGCNEMVFMEFSSKAQVTFLNCTLTNTTNKTFKIISKDDSVINFVMCKLQGDFIFESHDNSQIKNKQN